MHTYLILLAFFAIYSCSSENNNTKKPATKHDDTLPLPTNKFIYPELDKSPMDMSYYPVDYPKLKMAGQVTGPPVIRIIYSRPHRNNRLIFGGLLKYGEPWRLGANEATEIEFFRKARISGTTINPGRYILYCIPQPDKWTIILNNDLFTWGLKIDSTKDFLKTDVQLTKTPMSTEYLSMQFKKTEDGADLVIDWDDIQAKLPIAF